MEHVPSTPLLLIEHRSEILVYQNNHQSSFSESSNKRTFSKDTRAIIFEQIERLEESTLLLKMKVNSPEPFSE